jgi:hypothetical protein
MSTKQSKAEPLHMSDDLLLEILDIIWSDLVDGEQSEEPGTDSDNAA